MQQLRGLVRSISQSVVTSSVRSRRWVLYLGFSLDFSNVFVLPNAPPPRRHHRRRPDWANIATLFLAFVSWRVVLLHAVLHVGYFCSLLFVRLCAVNRRSVSCFRTRGEINVLMCGDPGTSKSQLLSFVHKVNDLY